MADREQSIWKKEIAFRRKPKPERRPGPPAGQPEQTSIWKKEITLRRKPTARQAPTPGPAPLRPESVAALLRPIAETSAPSLPPVSAPSPDAPPGQAAAPDVSPTPPAEAPAPAVPVVSEPEAGTAAKPKPEAEPEPTALLLPEPVELAETPVPADGPPVEGEADERELSRRERRRLAKEAKEAAKDAARQAKEAKKETRERGKAAKRSERYRKQKKLVGLKVGSTHLAAARVVNNGVPRVLQVAESPLERGIVVNGELREPDELAGALKAFFRRHKLPRAAVRLGVASNRIGVRVFELSGIDDPKQLNNAIRFRAQETLPIPLDEAVLDYRVLREEVGESGVVTRRVLLVVAHRELVERYVVACRKAGLRLHSVDLEPFALLRALAPGDERPDDAGIVVVSIGRDRSTVAVSDGTVCEYTRVLDWGGAALDAALARALDISPPEAEPIKHSLSLLETDPVPEGVSPEAAAAMGVTLRTELQAFTRDLLASLRYYQERPGSLGIAEIVLTGGGSRLAGLAEELERALGVRVRVGDPLSRVAASRKVRKAEPDGTLAAAIGLGIEE